MANEDLLKKYEKVSNNELISDYDHAVMSREHCLKVHSIDAHGHFHTASQLREIILSRMSSPTVVKLRIK